MPFKAVKIKAGDLKPGDCYERKIHHARETVYHLNLGERSIVWIWPRLRTSNRYFSQDETVYKIVWEDEALCKEDFDNA